MNYNDEQRKKQIERCRAYGPRHLTHIENTRKKLRQSTVYASEPTTPIIPTTPITPDWIIEKIEKELHYYSKAYSELTTKLQSLPRDQYVKLLLLLSRCKSATKPTTLPIEILGKRLTKAKYTHFNGHMYATTRVRWFQEHGKEPLFTIKDGKDIPKVPMTNDIQLLLDIYYDKTPPSVNVTQQSALNDDTPHSVPTKNMEKNQYNPLPE